MGLFDFNTKENKIKDLTNQIENDTEKYLKEANIVNKNIDLKVRDYNDQIPIINSLRNNEFGPQIHRLYKFLEVFGDVGVEISPFDFVTEKSRVNHHNDMSKADNFGDRSDERAYTVFAEQVASGMMAGAASTASSAVYCMASPALTAIPLVGQIPIVMLAFNAFKSDKEKKNKILELNEIIMKNQLSYKNDIAYRKQYFRTIEEAIAIAEIYRVNIKAISKSIEETILPELGIVKSFLMAEDVKNKIISNEEITDIKPESIMLYRDTSYHKHYTFVQNAYHFYITIVSFFSKPILTNLLEDQTITKKEKEEFNKSIEAIGEQMEQLKNNCIMMEEI